MDKSKHDQRAQRFGLAGRWFLGIMNLITARSSTSKDARAGLPFLGSSSYGKPHLTFGQQVAHLREKGMIIDDEAWAISYLSQIGYYRLSAYWHPFKVRSPADQVDGEKLKEGTRFEYILALYEYDRSLRQLILEGVEIIEVSLRVEVSYRLGQKDRFAYNRPDLLSTRFCKPDVNGVSDFARWHETYQVKLSRPNEDFTKHIIEKYGQPLPIWASVELWEFNQLSFFLSGLRHDDTSAIAARYGIPCHKMFLSWVKAIKGLRNHAAHHGRIWNRNMTAQPVLPDAGFIPDLDFIISDEKRIRQARACCPLLLMDLMIRRIDSSSTWPSRLKAHVRGFPRETGMSIEQMGFAPGWPYRFSPPRHNGV
jgi:abortive infection bacteriophage resistance protein